MRWSVSTDQEVVGHAICVSWNVARNEARTCAAIAVVGLTLIGIALFASLEVGAPVQARTPYDGLWSVSLKVSQGSCVDREIELFIRNGEISHAGDRGFFTAEGRVGERGRVEVSIGALGIWASADGQLSDGQGSGVWQFPERGCSGQWVARRSS